MGAKKVGMMMAAICLLMAGCSRSNDRQIALALFPLTGNVSSVGQYLRDGLQLGNEVLSNQFELVFEDSKADSREGHTAFRRSLLRNRPRIVFSAISGVALSIRDEAEKNGILHFSMVGSADLLTNESRYTYRFFPSTDYIAQEIVKWLNEQKFKRVAILYQNSEWGISYLESLVKHCKTVGIDMGYKSAVDLDRSQYQNIAEKVKECDVECVCVSMQGESYAELIKRIHLSGYAGFMVCDNNFTSAVALRCRDSLANVKVVDFCRPKGNRYVSFIREYERSYGGKPDMPAVLAYEVMQMIDAASKELGGYDAWKDNVKMQTFSYDGMMGRIAVEGREIRFPLAMKDACELLD